MTTSLDLLHYEIEHGTQRSVGVLYAIEFLTVDMLEHTREKCPAVNRAIINRWSHSGLERVKKIAWKIAGDLAVQP